MVKGECSLSTLHGSQRFNSSTFSCSMTAGDDSLREYLVTSVANQTNSPRPSDLLSTFSYVPKVPETAVTANFGCGVEQLLGIAVNLHEHW